jgi:hypothetical protein
MTFKIVQKRTVTWPVTVNIPMDGGKLSKQTFQAEFEVATQDQLDEWVRAGVDVLDMVFQGWKGVADEAGTELPFNDETKKKFLAITYVRAALFNAYAEVQHGREAARKN